MDYAHITSNHAFDTEVRINGPTVYIDIETTGVDALDVCTNKPRLISLCGDTGAVYVIDLFAVTIEKVFHLLRGKTLVGHNLSFDLAVLCRCGLPYPDEVRCTMVASQILCNGLNPPLTHNLGDCLERYLNAPSHKGLGKSDWGVVTLTPEQLEYSARDTEVLRALHAYLEGRLEVRDLSRVYALECQVIPAVVFMRLKGVVVDRDAWIVRSNEAAREEVVLRLDILSILGLPDPTPHKLERRSKSGGVPFKIDVAFNERVDAYNAARVWNLGSPTQVIEALRRIGVSLPDTQYATLVDMHDAHPILAKLIAWRDVEKESGAFGTDWLKHIRGDGRVHPDWRQVGPKSGRMACGKPNLQQVKRGVMRRGITASPGRVLVRSDFSQIEARVAAAISGDEVLTRLFMEGRDIHTYAAAQILGKPLENVTKGERQIGKSLVFGLLFSMSARSLRVYCRTNYGVQLTSDEATEFRTRFFQVFSGLALWHERTRRICYATDVRSCLGRRRVVEETKEKDWTFNTDTGRWEEPYFNRLGVFLNHPVQGTAADLLKAAVSEVWKLRAEVPWADLVMLVHDEIVLDCEESRAVETAKWLRSNMIRVGNSMLHPIPVDAETQISKTWGG